ncbi:winged helix-turn-helix transcriptional regulator [Haloarcula litorea]|uniref:winged helix-turn-helix transcriptional regulator n=1 Tax=Haloarcula litorea TaxID=3032579 RepID=UPI0023E896A4|nr:helix-turn-helix domain-containing protein [Halomicroarcula sp. GDY20]
MCAESESRQEDIEQQNDSACPIVSTIDQIGTPWRVNVIHALKDGEQRFNELKRSTGARSKTLSDALDTLVESDIVDRRVEEDAPIAVYYGLTTKGQELNEALGALEEWARDWDEEFSSESDGPL